MTFSEPLRKAAKKAIDWKYTVLNISLKYQTFFAEKELVNELLQFSDRGINYLVFDTTCHLFFDIVNNVDLPYWQHLPINEIFENMQNQPIDTSTLSNFADAALATAKIFMLFISTNYGGAIPPVSVYKILKTYVGYNLALLGSKIQNYSYIDIHNAFIEITNFVISSYRLGIRSPEIKLEYYPHALGKVTPI